jgi:hypothetical protein
LLESLSQRGRFGRVVGHQQGCKPLIEPHPMRERNDIELIARENIIIDK